MNMQLSPRILRAMFLQSVIAGLIILIVCSVQDNRLPELNQFRIIDAIKKEAVRSFPFASYYEKAGAWTGFNPQTETNIATPVAVFLEKNQNGSVTIQHPQNQVTSHLYGIILAVQEKQGDVAIVIQHPDGLVSVYEEVNNVQVLPFDHVQPGQLIGFHSEKGYLYRLSEDRDD